jgi:hypothetical protein
MGFGGYAILDFMYPDIITRLKDTWPHFLEKSKQQLGDDNIKILVK